MFDENLNNASYIIRTPRDLQQIGQDNRGVFSLARDIDLRSRLQSPFCGSEPFKGIFYGNGHKIKNLRIEYQHDTLVGLFSINGGLISDLHLVDAEVVGWGHVGGICGLSWGQIDNCTVSGRVAAWNDYVGGVAGALDYFGSDNLHHFNYEHQLLSGPIPLPGNVKAVSGSILDCSSSATVVSENTTAGGVVGSMSLGTTMDRCYSSGTVHGKLNDFYPSNLGRVVGYNAGSIRDIFSTGRIVIDWNDKTRYPQYVPYHHDPGRLIGQNDGRYHMADDRVHRGDKDYKARILHY